MGFFFSVFYQPVLNAVFFFMNLLSTASVVVGIFAFVVFFKTITYKLNVKSVKNQIRLSALSKKLKEYQIRYTNKRELAIKVNNLYKEKNVNPFSSIGFILIQAPILITLFFVVRDIARFDTVIQESLYSFVTYPLEIDITLLSLDLTAQGGLFFAIAVAFSQILFAKYSQKGIKLEEEQKKIQDKVLIALSVLIGIVSYFFSALLGMYFIITNLVSFLQEILFMQKIRKKELENLDS